MYNISKENTVISFWRNRRAPNRMGSELAEKLKDMLHNQYTVEEASNALNAIYDYHKEKNTWGIKSIRIILSDCPCPESQHSRWLCIATSAGTFVSYSEYLPLNQKTNYGSKRTTYVR